MNYFSSFYFRAKYWASQFFRKPLSVELERDFIYRPDFIAAPIQIVCAAKINAFDSNHLNENKAHKISDFCSKEISIQTGKEIAWEH